MAQGQAAHGSALMVTVGGAPASLHGNYDAATIGLMRELRRLLELEGPRSVSLLIANGVTEDSRIAQMQMNIYRDAAYGIKGIETRFCRWRGFPTGELNEPMCQANDSEWAHEFSELPEATGHSLRDIMANCRARVWELEKQFQQASIRDSNGNSTLVVIPTRDVLNSLLRAIYEVEYLMDESLGAQPILVAQRQYIG